MKEEEIQSTYEKVEKAYDELWDAYWNEVDRQNFTVFSSTNSPTKGKE